MDLVIDRKVWDRGNNDGWLLRECQERKQCCVGIFLTALGADDSCIRGRVGAEKVHSFSVPEWLVRRKYDDLADMEEATASDEANRLYRANDLPDLPDVEREQRIAAVFAAHGVNVTFTGD